MPICMALPRVIKSGWAIRNLFIEIEKDFTVYGDEANLVVAKHP